MNTNVVGRVLKVWVVLLLLVGVLPVMKSYAANTNLVTNGGFESNLASWSNWDGVTTVTSPVYEGSRAARLGTGESGAGQIIDGITPSTKYELSGAGEVSVTGETAILGVDCLDVNGVRLAGGKFELFYTTTAYTPKTLTFTTIPGTAKLQVYIYKNPNIGGYGYIDNIALTPATPDSGTGGGTKALWVWELSDLATSAARSELIQFSLSKGINMLYVNTGTNLTTNPSHYRALIAQAHANDMQVEALDGQSDWVRAENHPIPLGRLQDVIDYNAASAVNERFDGVHHDNEPYTLPDWSTNRQELSVDYLDLAAKSQQLLTGSGSSMTFSGDIPFWYDTFSITHNGVTKEMHKHVQDVMDYVTIMDYRDFAEGPDGIIQNGQNEVDYGSAIGKQVVIGVETYDVPGDPEFVTFYQEGEAYMNQELEKVDAYFTDSDGYGGLAIHYYTTYKNMLP